MIVDYGKISKIVDLMDKQLREELLMNDGKVQEKKLWENTFIKHQVDKRNDSGTFDTSDHIRAMVYSMLSSSMPWERVESGIDFKTGKISTIDEIFHQYDTDYLLKCTPDELADKIKELGCASQSTRKQMTALISKNVPKLIQLEKEYGSVDTYYQKFIDKDKTLKSLIKALSDTDSKDKMAQLDVALNAEYLKNIGHSIAKPDRHIRRILGSNVLGCSESETVPVYEAFDIVAKLAEESEKTAAEVDYILWSYCANGYGEICTSLKPKCDKCVVKKYCHSNIN
jgi:3-methyladenine DNA glycosylase Tag